MVDRGRKNGEVQARDNVCLLRELEWLTCACFARDNVWRALFVELVGCFQPEWQTGPISWPSVRISDSRTRSRPSILPEIRIDFTLSVVDRLIELVGVFSLHARGMLPDVYSK